MNKTRYGAVAGAYDSFLSLIGFKKGIEHFLDRIDLSLPRTPRLLDVGCGTGLLACYFAKRFPEAEIYATDIDVKMLREMELVVEKEGLNRRAIVIAESDLKNPEKITPLGRREATNLSANHFDAVVASGALEHAPLTDTVFRLARLLKPGGLFLNLAMRRSPIGATLGMMFGTRPHKIANMRRAFERAGLEDIRIAKLSVNEFPANLSRVAVIAKKREI